MRTNRLAIWTLTFAVAILAAGCGGGSSGSTSTDPGAGGGASGTVSAQADGPVGTYQREGQAFDVLELHDDGSYCVHQSGSGTVEGTYEISGNKLRLTSSNGKTEEGPLENAVYTDPNGEAWTKTALPQATCS